MGAKRFDLREAEILCGQVIQGCNLFRAEGGELGCRKYGQVRRRECINVCRCQRQDTVRASTRCLQGFDLLCCQ
jgi:hypothetical protein